MLQRRARSLLTRPAAVLLFLTGISARSVLHGNEIATYKAEIGFTSLEVRLATSGEPLPTAAGVWVMQVEAAMPGNRYLPDIASLHSELLGKMVHPESGPGGGPSSHATTVGRSFYGSKSSIAPGIESIDAYIASDYLASGYLRGLEVKAPRRVSRPPKVQNHSWVSYGLPPGGGFTAAEISNDLLRRLDFVIERDQVISVVGVANVKAMPAILAGSYNAIAVGTSDALSSVGPTMIDVPGRLKPDLVAPGKFPRGSNTTSVATPRVSAAAALLVETGSRLSDSVDAVRPQTVKAVLLAGATKDAFPSWSHSDTEPLDSRYGAGLLNIDNSHRILTAGRTKASESTLVPATGWDCDTAAPGADKHYVFECTSKIKSLSIVASWLRRIDVTEAAGKGGTARLRPSLANIDLKLQNARGFTPELLLAQSISPIDNVEHIFDTDLPAGRYVISLSSDQPWDFALAWDAQVAARANPLTWILWGSGIVAVGLFCRWTNGGRRAATA